MDSEQQPQSPAEAYVLGPDQEATQVYHGDARAALAALGPETAAAPASPQGQPAGSDMESASQKEEDPAAQQGQSAEQGILGAASDDVQMAEGDADAADGQQHQQVGAASLCSSALSVASTYEKLMKPRMQFWQVIQWSTQAMSSLSVTQMGCRKQGECMPEDPRCDVRLSYAGGGQA